MPGIILEGNRALKSISKSKGVTQKTLRGSHFQNNKHCLWDEEMYQWSQYKQLEHLGDKAKAGALGQAEHSQLIISSQPLTPMTTCLFKN